MRPLLVFLAVFLVSVAALAQDAPPAPAPAPAAVGGTALVYSALALAIGFAVRMLKDDKFVFPAWFALPSSMRPLLALVLGAGGGVIDSLARGTPWQTALLLGLSAAFAAMTGHAAIVEGMRGGKEIGSGPPTLPLAALVAFSLAGCAALSSPTAKTIEKDAITVAECAIPAFEMGDTPEAVAILCGISLLEAQRLQAAHIVSQKRNLGSCAKPAGSK